MLRRTTEDPSGRRLETVEDVDEIVELMSPPPPFDNARAMSEDDGPQGDLKTEENVGEEHADDDDDESRQNDAESPSLANKPPPSVEEKEVKRQKAAEKKQKKEKEEKKKKKKKSEAKKSKREKESTAANHQGNAVIDASESTSHVEESEVTSCSNNMMDESEATMSRNNVMEEIHETGIQEEKTREEASGQTAALLPIEAAEPTKPARANASSIPIAAEPPGPALANKDNSHSSSANWIDRKTRPGRISGQPRQSGRSQDVGGSRIPVVVADSISTTSSSINSGGDSPWTPSNLLPGQSRTVLASSLKMVKRGEDKTKNITKDGDKELFDVEQGDHGPQEYNTVTLVEKDVDHEKDADSSRGQDVIDTSAQVGATQPGAFNVRGINHSSSLQSTVMSTNSSVPNINNHNNNDDEIAGAPLVAHLVEENPQPSYRNIVVAVEDDSKAKERYDPRRQRRQRLILAAFIVVFLVVVLVVGVALGMTLTTHPPDEEPEPDLWYQVVPPIDGDGEDGDFGSSVSMCSDGSRVAVGAQGNGEVKVYELLNGEGGDLKQIGRTLQHNIDNMLTSFIRSRVVVELSSNCQVLAIGCPFSNIDNKTMAGRVVLYKYNSASDSWEPLGNPNVIPGEDESDFSGASLALSQTGDHIAIGSPGNDWAAVDCGRVRVFLINNDGWELLGMPLNGTFPGEEFGGSVSLANEQTFDTYMLAVGSSSRTSIRDAYGNVNPEAEVAVRVFELETGNWQQRGQGFVPQVLSVDTAWFVKLSSDGLKLVISNLYLEPDGIGINEDNDGIYVAAFELDDSKDKWVPRGDSIHQNFPGKKSGYIISLSENGERIGMGDPGKEGAGGLSGHAHFYEFNGDQWCQLGPDIDGEAAGDMAGYSVSLSGNGKRMVIAAPKSRALGSEHGRVMVVELHEDRIVPKCEGISLHHSRR